jgi:putative ABC transport system permease protein
MALCTILPMASDLLIATRSILGRPGYSVTAILTLALGIGATTAMFTTVHGVLLRPLPGHDSGRLVAITQESSRRALNMPAQDSFRIWQKEAKSFEAIAGQQNCPYTWTGPGRAAEQVMIPCVTAGYFTVLGVRPLLGRDILPSDKRVALLDHTFWIQRFSANATAIGSELLLDKEPFQIVGVLPEEFHPFGRGQTKFYVPFDIDRNPASLNVTARLRDNVTIDQARSEMKLFDAREPGRDIRTLVTPLLDHHLAGSGTLLWTLFGASAFVLLLACLNVAGLMLVRGAERQQEFAIRTALGATRASLVRTSVVECLLISVPGAFLGIAVSYALVRVIALSLDALPRVDDLAVNSLSVAFAAATAVLSGLIAGILPALRVTSQRPRTTGVQRALSVAEVAVAFVLLTGAALLLHSFYEIRKVDLGYRPANVWTAFFSLPEGARESETAAYSRLRERMARIPGVESVATATALPMGGVTINMLVYREGEDPSQPKPNEKGALLQYISPGYLQTAGIPLRSGRPFDNRDRKGSPHVAIVSENLARRYFSGDAIGKRLLIPEVRFDMNGIDKWVLWEIVGVAGSIRRSTVTDTESMDIYLPEAQNPLRLTYLVVRNSNVATDMFRQALVADFPELPSSDHRTLEDRGGYLIQKQRDGLTLLGVFGGLALALAITGVFAVISYTIGQRGKELGIRIAVGAAPGDLRRLVLGETLRMTLIGLAIGVLAAVVLSRLLQSLLFGISGLDPVSILGSATLLVLSGLMAAWQPASKAARTDPAGTLRADTTRIS